MKNRRNSAFTIVELVIVIAVIAILSAVLIPTFGAIIKNANIASDQTSASVLTTELHVGLVGETIDNEAELMKAIKDIDPKKLTPKAAQHGVHFWFDRETQTIIAKTADEVQDIKAERLARAATPVKEGPMLMSNVTPLSTESANVSFRDIYNCGIFLIDKGGSYIAEAINKIDVIADAEGYEEVINLIGKAVEEDDDTDYVELVQTIVVKTTIKTEAGSFFANGESETEYISATATYIGNIYVNVTVNDKNEVTGTENKDAAPAPSGPVEIPSNIEFAVEGSLNYSTDESGAKVEISVSAESKVEDVLTNGTVNENVQVNVDGTIYVPNADGNLETDKVDAEVPVIKLSLKLPFEEFKVGFVTGTDVIGDNSKVYVAFRNDYLQLHAVNAANANETSNKVTKWEIVTEGEYGVTVEPETGRLDLRNAKLINNVCEVVVRATASNMNGEERVSEITVVVVKPIAATIAIGTNNIAFVDGATMPTLTFNGVHTSYAITIRATYSGDSEGNNPLQPAPILTVSNEDGLIYENKKLTFQTNENGELAEGVNFSFTATVDGYFSKDIDVDVIDATQAAVKLNYNKLNSENAPNYYIGTNANGTDTTILLSDLFKIANSDKFGNKVKVTLYAYAESSGYLSPRSELNKVATANPNQYTLTATYDSEVTTAEWATSAITFKGNIKTTSSVFIEIAPENDVSTVVEIQIVNNAINVTKSTPITTLAKTHSTNVVLHSDVTLATGQKIGLGTNSLYGNGWIISANTFKSNLTDKTDLTDALISVNGGTIDNVYIDGPVYGALDYADNTNKYYVSGIRAQGTSTISNSYVSGFRQPVMAAGTTLNITNTTLRGGNYANLVLSSGVLNLTDITTIQDVNGMTPTVDTSTYTTPVMGLGIAIEGTAMRSADSKINLYGYLDQYNWAKYRTNSDPALSMPTINSLSTGDIFKCVFEGVKMRVLWYDVHAEMGSVKYFIHKDKNASSGYGQYVNTGIVFVELTQAAEGLTISQSFVNDKRTTENNVTKRTMKLLDMPFDKTGLDLKIAKITAKDYLGTYGRFVIWSYQDGRQWTAQSPSIGLGSATRLVTCSNETTNYIVSDTPISGITTKTPLTYTDFYSTGVYADAYK